jgi:hypothetical protein
MHRRFSSLLLSLWIAGLLGTTGARAATAAMAATVPPLALPPPAKLLRVYIPSGIILPSDAAYEIFRDGTEFVTERNFEAPGQASSCEVSWGVLTPATYAQLATALAVGQVGTQRGQCGIQASSHGPGYITVTWYGQNGRTSSFAFGTGSQDGCSAGIKEIIAALPLLGDNEVQPLTACPPP